MGEQNFQKISCVSELELYLARMEQEGKSCRRKAAKGNNGIDRINDVLEHMGKN